jgi:hypothetical protein
MRFFIFAFIAILICGCPAREATESSLNKIKTMSVKGVVTYKGDLPKPYPCFGNIIVKSADKSDTIETCHCSAGSELWNSISIGDSILKPLGNSQIEIHKATTGEVKKIEYPNCFY